MKLQLNVEGASEQEEMRGLEAAKKVFDKAGVDPLTASAGMFALEGWDIAGFPEEGEHALSAEDQAAADVWLEANEAAMNACCEGWDPSRPTEGELELIFTDEEAEKLAGPDDEPDD